MSKREASESEKEPKRRRQYNSRSSKLPLTTLQPYATYIEVGKSNNSSSSPIDSDTRVAQLRLSRLHYTPLSIGLASEIFDSELLDMSPEARGVVARLHSLTDGFRALRDYILLNGEIPVIMPSPMHAFVCMMLALDASSIDVIITRYGYDPPAEMDVSKSMKAIIRKRKLIGFAVDLLTNGSIDYQDPDVRLRPISSLTERDMLHAMCYCFHEALVFKDPISGHSHTCAIQFSRALMSTGDAYIIEASKPLKKGVYNRWGASIDKKQEQTAEILIRGENITGKALMTVRRAAEMEFEQYQNSTTE